MQAARETILAVVTQEPSRRLLIVVCEQNDKPILLRTESFSTDVGWYSQQEVALSRAELAGLKNVLGIQVPKSCERAHHLSEARQESAARIYSFAEAAPRRA